MTNLNTEGSTPMRFKMPKALAALLAVAALAGGTTAGVAQATGGHAHAARHHKKHHRHHSRIPQHNGGDHDADNNGGPSDGDGNI
jgi:Spy/CpxP family protein refolding chaperone